MQTIINELQLKINTFSSLISNVSEDELTQKPRSGKWSKKEIIGHLIDSALNNLRRFTEIQHTEGVYTIYPYQQAPLVAINDYQNLPMEHLVKMWEALNQQIVEIMKSVSKKELVHSISIPHENREVNLRFVMKDYVEHLSHHWAQIFG